MHIKSVTLERNFNQLSVVLVDRENEFRVSLDDLADLDGRGELEKAGELVKNHIWFFEIFIISHQEKIREKFCKEPR